MAKATELTGRTVTATDGDVGTVEDLYFDDERWAVRYLVVRCGGWLSTRRVLLSPATVERHDERAGALVMKVSKEQIRNSPDMDTEQPVSRHLEAAHAAHYGYPYYWRGPHLWGAMAYPGIYPVPVVPPAVPADAGSGAEVDERLAAERQAAERSHLRSCREVMGYSVRASDGAAGEVDELLVDDRSWAVTHLVVDAKPWWPGGQVLLAPGAVKAIDWASRSIDVDMTREALKASRPAP